MDMTHNSKVISTLRNPVDARTTAASSPALGAGLRPSYTLLLKNTRRPATRATSSTWMGCTSCALLPKRMLNGMLASILKTRALAPSLPLNEITLFVLTGGLSGAPWARQLEGVEKVARAGTPWLDMPVTQLRYCDLLLRVAPPSAHFLPNLRAELKASA